MGFYPKHLKRARHDFIMRCIANAALAGAMFENFDAGYSFKRWRVAPSDNRLITGYYDSKGAAAIDYLFFHFDRVGITPAWARPGAVARSGNHRSKRRGAARRITGLRSSLHG